MVSDSPHKPPIELETRAVRLFLLLDCCNNLTLVNSGELGILEQDSQYDSQLSRRRVAVTYTSGWQVKALRRYAFLISSRVAEASTPSIS